MKSGECTQGRFSKNRRCITSVGVGLLVAAVGTAAFTIWNLQHQSGSAVVALAVLSIAAGGAVLFRIFALQFRRLEQSKAALAAQNLKLESQGAELARAAEALNRANEEALAERTRSEETRRLGEETTRQLLEAQRIGKIGHWYSDDLAKTTTWSPQMFEMLDIPTKAVLSLPEARAFVHPDDIGTFMEKTPRSDRDTKDRDRREPLGASGRPGAVDPY